MITAPRVFGEEDANIRGEMHEATLVARGQIDIGDNPVQGMGRVDRETRRAVELGIAPDIAKFPPAGERPSRFDLKGDNSHGAPPAVRSGNASSTCGRNARLFNGASAARMTRPQRSTSRVRS